MHDRMKNTIMLIAVIGMILSPTSVALAQYTDDDPFGADILELNELLDQIYEAESGSGNPPALIGPDLRELTERLSELNMAPPVMEGDLSELEPECYEELGWVIWVPIASTIGIVWSCLVLGD